MQKTVKRECSLYLVRLGFVPLLVVGTDLRVLTKKEDEEEKGKERESKREDSKWDKDGHKVKLKCQTWGNRWTAAKKETFSHWLQYGIALFSIISSSYIPTLFLYYCLPFTEIIRPLTLFYVRQSSQIVLTRQYSLQFDCLHELYTVFLFTYYRFYKFITHFAILFILRHLSLYSDFSKTLYC